ncbi:MAG: SUF system NifU family Fe-S cluster assembly protein [Candidatus Margulisiibacteriota bacterium]|jgi:nitrogen fixation NifU-like protein
MNTNLEQLYQNTILEHNKNPRNFQKLAEFTHSSQGKNPLCGDDYTIYLKINNNIIEDVGFVGQGCAISKSSASILTTYLKGKTIKEAFQLKEKFIELVTKESCQDCSKCLGKLQVFEGVKKYPIRIKCATLIWHALEEAINKGEKND